MKISRIYIESNVFDTQTCLVTSCKNQKSYDFWKYKQIRFFRCVLSLSKLFEKSMPIPWQHFLPERSWYDGWPMSNTTNDNWLFVSSCRVCFFFQYWWFFSGRFFLADNFEKLLKKILATLVIAREKIEHFDIFL